MRRGRGDEGLALVWLALTLVLLIGMAGFATDLGWLYLNTSRAQKAVDSAALAGVVNLPGFPLLAESDAKDAARANGYDPDGADTLIVTPLSEDRLHAELRTRIDTFFLTVLGFDHFDITREATSEYLKPIPLGSPKPCFGQDGNGDICPPTDPTDFWAAVSAPYTHKEDGDPFSTQCNPNASASGCDVANPDFNRGPGGYNGYYYGIEIPEGSANLAVSIYDARFDERPDYPNIESADSRYSPGQANPGVTTHFQLHEVDTSPSDPTNNPTISGCAMNLDPDTDAGVVSPETNQWVTLCSVGSPIEGIYMLHVWSSGEGSGTNQFAIGATTTTDPQPRVYGINDMSIFSNRLVPGSPSQLYLAEIEEGHAGKKLELEFFDAGDAQGHSEMHVRDPFGNLPPNCTYEIWNHDQTSLLGTGSGCSWVTSDPGGAGIQIFNNQWIKALIDLPDDPEAMCNEALGEDLECFWHMELALSQPNERTTWRARVIGNPVRLIPDPEPEPEPAP